MQAAVRAVLVMLPPPLTLFLTMVLVGAMDTAHNNDTIQVVHPPTVNISFIKEVTLSVAPQDFELTPHDEQEVASFLESGLRLLDPIMRFFDGLVGWSPPPQQEVVHA